MVVDASAVVEWLIRSRRGEAVARRIGEHHGHLHAPDLLLVEVANALRRLEHRGLIDRQRAELSFSAARALNVVQHEPAPFLDRMWPLRRAMSSYDAMYVALAEVLNVPLLTCDLRLARAHGHAATIDAVG